MDLQVNVGNLVLEFKFTDSSSADLLSTLTVGNISAKLYSVFSIKLNASL